MSTNKGRKESIICNIISNFLLLPLLLHEHSVELNFFNLCVHDVFVTEIREGLIIQLEAVLSFLIISLTNKAVHYYAQIGH